jgi:hypothetical protein
MIMMMIMTQLPPIQTQYHQSFCTLLDMERMGFSNIPVVVMMKGMVAQVITMMIMVLMLMRV